MKKPYLKSTKVLPAPIEIAQLPVLVPRPLACDFSLLSGRTFIRAEERGELHAVRRSPKSGVCYRREELLQFLGLGDAKLDLKRAHRRRRATA